MMQGIMHTLHCIGSLIVKGPVALMFIETFKIYEIYTHMFQVVVLFSSLVINVTFIV